MELIHFSGFFELLPDILKKVPALALILFFLRTDKFLRASEVEKFMQSKMSKISGQTSKFRARISKQFNKTFD